MGETARMLRQARLRAGMSQQELSRRARVSQPVLSAYENGRREPSAKTFRHLLRAAGAAVTLEDRWDAQRNGRHFELVMELTDHLPQRPRGELMFPSFRGVDRR